jgi:hypothetical protein
MPRPRIVNRDDELDIDLRGVRTRQTIPSLGGPVHAPSASIAMAVVKTKYMSAGRVAGFTAYMQKDKHADSDRAVEGYSTYMQHDRAQLFTAEGRECDQDASETYCAV